MKSDKNCLALQDRRPNSTVKCKYTENLVTMSEKFKPVKNSWKYICRKRRRLAEDEEEDDESSDDDQWEDIHHSDVEIEVGLT